MTPKCWAVFVARLILGLIFFAAGFWKVFRLSLDSWLLRRNPEA